MNHDFKFQLNAKLSYFVIFDTERTKCNSIELVTYTYYRMTEEHFEQIILLKSST